MPELPVDQRIAQTYHEAIAARQALGPPWTISVHVGQEIYDYLKALASRVAPVPGMRNTIFGFPLVLDGKPDDIQVRATRIIVP